MSDIPENFRVHRDRLNALYGLDFPATLFHFYAFLSEEPVPIQNPEFPLAISLTGHLQVLDRLVTGKPVPDGLPIRLHYRFYGDLPDFFTCLHGDTDGLHWGNLLDEPSLGFRGVGSYYNNDGDEISVYGGLFHAMRVKAEQGIESSTENMEEDPKFAEDYRRDIQNLEGFIRRLDRYVEVHDILLDEGRPDGIKDGTGLDLILAGSESQHLTRSLTRSDLTDPVPEAIAGLVTACESGDVIRAFIAGRSLWYWGGNERSEDAWKLLRAVYRRTERRELAEVLDLHYQNRDMKSVDLFRGK